MADVSSAATDPCAALRPTSLTQNTSRNTATSSPPCSIEFYFQIAVLVIAVVGTAANALVLYALVASKQHKKNALIVHQNALDTARIVRAIA